MWCCKYFKLQLLSILSIRLLSAMFAKEHMQSSLCEEIEASSKAFGRRMVLVLRMLQHLIIPSQEHVCSLLMLLFAGSSAQSRQIHDCRGAGSHSASRFRDTNTCTHTTHPPLSPSLWRTHASQGTQSNHCSKRRRWWPLWIESKPLDKSTLADLSVTTPLSAMSLSAPSCVLIAG